MMRLFVAAAGGVILFGLFAAEIALPTLMYDGPDGIPTASERIISSVPPLFMGVLFLIPFRLSYSRPWFELRFAIFFLISLWCFYMGCRSILEYLGGGKHWMIVPAGALIGALGVCLPVSLWSGRKLWRQGREAPPVG